MTTAVRSRSTGRWQTRSPFWWQGPDGAKVLMAYTRQYSQLWFVCGLPPREAGCRDGLPHFFQTFESPGYRPDAVLMFGSQLENTDLIPGEGEFVRAWNAKYAWPHLQLATFRDYFEPIEKKFGDQLETVRGDFGPYWEDGIGTDAQYAAIYRQTESRALGGRRASPRSPRSSSPNGRRRSTGSGVCGAICCFMPNTPTRPRAATRGPRANRAFVRSRPSIST